jgi:hypothetical protein
MAAPVKLLPAEMSMIAVAKVRATCSSLNNLFYGANLRSVF